MDTTTAVTPLASAWELLAELAAFGQNTTVLSNADGLAQRIVDRVCSHLQCPWAFLILQNVGAVETVADHGLDEPLRQKLLNNGHHPPAEALAISLEVDRQPAGTLWLAETPQLVATLQPSLVMALRRQLELLISLQRHEAGRRNEAIQRDTASLLSLDLVGQLDLRQVMRALFERATVLSEAQAAAVFMLNEDQSLDLVVGHNLPDTAVGQRLASGEDLAGQVARSRKSLTIQDYQNYEHRIALWNGTLWQSMIAVPLLVQDELIGVLQVMRGTGQPVFTLADQRMLESFTRPAALVLRNAQLFAQQQQRSRELYVLYENGQVISATLNIDPMLTRVAENIALAMSADGTTLHLVDANDATLLYEAASYDADGSSSTDRMRYAISTQPAISQLLNQAEPLIVTRRPGVGDTQPNQEVAEFFGYNSLLLLPLKIHDQAVGLLGVGYSRHDHQFSRAEIILAQTLAGQITTAVVNARLYEAEQRRAADLETLQSISEHLSSDQTLEETLDAIIGGVSSLVRFEGVQVSLYEIDEQLLTLALARGLQGDETARRQFKLSEGLTGWVARYRRALRLDTLSRPPVRPVETRLTGGTPVRSYLGVPLLAGDQLVGVLELYSGRTRSFSPVDERLLSIASGAAARAISTARRSEQADEYLRSRVLQLTALQRISRQLTATLSLDSILNFAIREALRATPATQGYVALREGRKDDLQLIDAETAELMGYVALEDPGERRPFQVIAAAGYSSTDHSAILGTSLSGAAPTAAIEALGNGEPALIDELHSDDRLHGIGPEVASALAMPIFYEEHIVGVVNLHSQTAHAFDHDALEFVRALTDQAALAIGNAQRYQEQVRQRELLQQRASMLNEVLGIGQALRADRSLEEVLEQIAFSVVEIARYRSVVFNVVDPEDPEVMRVLAGAGLPLTELERIRGGTWPQGLVQRFLDKSFRLGRCFFIPGDAMQRIMAGVDVSEILTSMIADMREVDEWQVDDALFVPLYSTRARLLGLMSVDDPFDRQRPTRRTVEPLEIFADQAAIAIENANLLREARNQADQMKALFQVGAATVASLKLDELLERVYEEIVAYLGTPSFLFIASYNSQHNSIRFEMFKQDGQILMTHHKNVVLKSGLTGLIIDTGESLYIHDYQAERNRLPVQGVLVGPDVRSWVGIPLRSQNQVIGILSVQSTEPFAFKDRDIQFLTTLANQLAVALENARLFQERERRLAELDVINKVSSITSATLDLEQMLNQIYDRLAGFLTVDAGYVYIHKVDEHGNGLMFSVDEQVRSFEYLYESVSPGSMTDRILQTHQPLLFRNLLDERRDVGVQPVYFGNVQRSSASWLGVPLIVGEDNVIGVLSVQSYTPNVYGERESAFLATVASQIALGIQNARLFDETQRGADALQSKVGELSALLESARVLSSPLKPREVLDRLMEVVRGQLHVTTVALWTVNDQQLQPAALLGFPRDTSQTMAAPLGVGLLGQVVVSGAPLVLEEVAEDEPTIAFDRTDGERLTSFMGVPVIYRQETVGVLSVLSADRRTFSADEVKLLAGMADQAAIALENARLFEERERRISELTTLNRISQAINATLELGELLQALHRGIGEVLDISESFIALHDPATRRLTFPVHWAGGSSAPTEDVLIVDDPTSLPQRVIIERKPILLRSEAEVAALSSTLPEPGAPRLGSWLGVPIIQGEDALGILNVQSYQPEAYDENDLRFLTTVASQAATAIANARLFGERERRLREVSVMKDIGSALTSTLDLKDLLERLLGELGRVIDVSTSMIVLYDADHETLSYPSAYDNGQMISFPTIPLERGGINRWVIVQRQPLLIGTYQEAEQYRSGPRVARIGLDQDEESFLVVPIIANDEVVGVINIQSYAQNAFGQDDLRFVSTVANQAAIAINNARIFQERGRRIEELATFNEIGQQLSAVMRLDELVELIYRQTSRLLDTTNFYVALYDERREEISFPLFYERGQRIAATTLVAKDSLTHHIIRRREPLLLQGNTAGAVLAVHDLHPVGPHAKSWLGVPMIASDHVIGVIGIQDYERENAYSQDDVRLLSTIASWGAVAMENARLLGATRQSVQEMEALYAVSVALAGTLETSEVQQIVASSAVELLNVDVGVVLLFNPGRTILSPFVFDNASLDHIQVEALDPSDALHQMLLAQDRTVALNDCATLEAPPALASQLGLRGMLGIMIGSREHPLGSIWLGMHEPRDWRERESSLLSILSSLSRKALESAHLFDEVRRFAAELEQRVNERTAELSLEKERLQAVHAITLELTASLDLDETLTKTLALASRALNVKRGSIMLSDSQTRTLICRAVLGGDGTVHPTRLPITFEKGPGLIGWVMEHQQPIRIGDVQKDPRWLHEQGRADEVRSVIAVPLMQDGPLGVLMLTSPQIDYFTPAQLQLLSTIANEVAIVIHNAELHSYIISQAMRLSDLFEQQREETSKNQAILQSLGEGVIVLDEQDQVILFNPAAEQMLDIPAMQVLNQPLTQISAWGDGETRKRAGLIYEGLDEGLSALARQSQNHNRRLELPSPKQTIELNFAPVVGPDGAPYGSVVVLRDITREIEADIAKRDFISSVSHELRTPLTSIRGYVDLLLLGAAGQLDEGQVSFLKVVKNNSNRLMDLINDILEIGRIDANKVVLNFDQVKVQEVLQDVMQTMRAEIERKSLDVRLDIVGDMPEISADPRRLTQVVMNLVSNAVKYTFPGGRIVVRTFLNPAGMLEVDVEDNGVGISEEDQRNLFRRFYRADNPLRDEAGGTGLGLSIAKSFVELHGGEMWVRSEVGQGSTFSFIIPVAQPEHTSTAEAA